MHSQEKGQEANSAQVLEDLVVVDAELGLDAERRVDRVPQVLLRLLDLLRAVLRLRLPQRDELHVQLRDQVAQRPQREVALVDGVLADLRSLIEPGVAVGLRLLQQVQAVGEVDPQPARADAGTDSSDAIRFSCLPEFMADDTVRSWPYVIGLPRLSHATRITTPAEFASLPTAIQAPG